MKSLSGPDNSPEAKEARRRAYEPFSGQNPDYYWQVPNEDEDVLHVVQGPGPTHSFDFEHTPWAKHQRVTRSGNAVLHLVEPHAYAVPEVTEKTNVVPFPVERRNPEPKVA